MKCSHQKRQNMPNKMAEISIIIGIYKVMFDSVILIIFKNI